MENTIVVGIGEALWDVLPEGKKIGGARLICISCVTVWFGWSCG